MTIELQLKQVEHKITAEKPNFQADQTVMSQSTV